MDFMRIYQHPARLYILAFNIIAMIASVGLAAVGIFGLSGNSHDILQSDTLSWALIVLSLFVFLVSFLGCATALGESKRILGAYGILVALLVLVQLSLIIYALTQHDRVDALLDQAWQKAYEHNPRLLQDIETRLACCGFASVGDRAVPKSSNYACRESPAFGYHTPCQKQLKESYMRHQNALLVVVTGIQFLQLLALAATIVLWNQLPSDEEIEERFKTEHGQRILRGLRSEDRGQRDYREENASQSDERRGTGGGSRYGSTDQGR